MTTRVAAADSTPPKPRVTARGAGVAAACWVGYALLYASAITASEGAPFAGVLLGQLISAVLLALLSVPAWLLVVRRMDRAGAAWKVAAHAALAPCYAVLGTEAYLAITRAGAGPAVAASVEARYGWIALTYAVLYALQFALYHAVRAVERLRWKEREAAELAALARERELAALKAQVNPHFLFNTLNSISAATGRDPDAARAMIEQLAGLLRYATGRSNGSARGGSNAQDGNMQGGNALATLEEEVAFAHRYLALEGRRFGERLTTRFHVDEAALPARLPPMTLQPLVENAVRHGIAPLEAGGAVTVRAEHRDGRVRISVEDTGAGLNAQAPGSERAARSNALPEDALPEDALPESATGGGTGLQNTSARLVRHFGEDARLHAATNQPRGFRVWFSVPAEAGES